MDTIKRYPACKCGDSRLCQNTNLYHLCHTCQQCSKAYFGPLCQSCNAHRCSECRIKNQNQWKQKISTLGNWNALHSNEQKSEYIKFLKNSITKSFIFYNSRDLVQEMCNNIYDTKNMNVCNIFYKIVENDDRVLIKAFYNKFELALVESNIQELIAIQKLNIIRKRFLIEFRKRHKYNILHYVCNFFKKAKTPSINMQIEKRLSLVKFILQLIIDYKLLQKNNNVYNISSIYQLSSIIHSMSSSSSTRTIIELLDMYVMNEIKQKGETFVLL